MLHTSVLGEYTGKNLKKPQTPGIDCAWPVGIPHRTAYDYMREAGRCIGKRFADTPRSKSTVAEDRAAKARSAVTAKAEAFDAVAGECGQHRRFSTQLGGH